MLNHASRNTAHLIRQAFWVAIHAFRHILSAAELILVTVRIGEIDDRAFLALGRCFNRFGVRDFVLIKPAQVQIDVFVTNVEPATRKILAQFFCQDKPQAEETRRCGTIRPPTT